MHGRSLASAPTAYTGRATISATDEDGSSSGVSLRDRDVSLAYVPFR